MDKSTEARITKGSLDTRACSRGRLEETSGVRRLVAAQNVKLHTPGGVAVVAALMSVWKTTPFGMTTCL